MGRTVNHPIRRSVPCAFGPEQRFLFQRPARFLAQVISLVVVSTSGTSSNRQPRVRMAGPLEPPKTKNFRPGEAGFHGVSNAQMEAPLVHHFSPFAGGQHPNYAHTAPQLLASGLHTLRAPAVHQSGWYYVSKPPRLLRVAAPSTVTPNRTKQRGPPACNRKRELAR